MSAKHIGKQTVKLQSPVAILAAGSVVGKKEGEGEKGERKGKSERIRQNMK